MDRLTQLRGGAGGSRDASLDGSAAGDSFLTANDTPSKYYSLSEDDSFDIAKDVSLATATAPPALNDDCLISNLSPIGKKDILDYKIGKQIEAANILSGGVDIFDDNENSYDGNELVIDDNVEIDDKSPSLKSPESSDLAFPKGDDQLGESALIEDMGGSKETEVVLQIDGKNVDAINIGNGLYLYRKEGQEELAAVQIIDDDHHHQPSFKFLKVRENAEGNLEVYEEIEIEVPKEAPVKEGKPAARNTAHVPIKDISQVISDPGSSKVVDKKVNLPVVEDTMTTPKKQDNESSKDELNLNGKMVKISESRKSPLMAYHSTPNKEGIPLTKTMVDQKLHPSRHSDNNKKTIEVHTDSGKQKTIETTNKSKEIASPEKSVDAIEVHKPIDKKLPLKDETSEITKESRLDLSNIEDESIEVIDIIEGKKNDDKVNAVKEPVKLDVTEVKDILIDEPKPVDVEIKLSIEDKKQEKVEKSDVLIPNLVSTESFPNEKEEKSDKISEKVDASLEPSSSIKLDETPEKQNEPTVPSEAQEIKQTVRESQDYLKEKVTETLSSGIKIPENHQLKEVEDSTPSEIIEVDEIDADEDNLIIEEIVDSPHIVLESDKIDVKEPSSTEIKNMTENQLQIEESNAGAKIQESNEKVHIKPTLPVEITEKVVERPESKNLKKEEKVATISTPTEPSAETSTKLESKPEGSNKLKTEGTSSDNTQLNDASKTDDTMKLELNKNRNTELVGAKVNKDLTKIEPSSIKKDVPNLMVKSSNDSVAVTPAKSVTGTQMSFQKPETVPTKLNIIPNPTKNVDSSIAQGAKITKPIAISNKESSTALDKVQSQINLPKNTQNLAKPVVLKLEVKPAIEKKSETNHKTDLPNQSSVDVKPKSINNNHAPVPFGKWTEANRQDFLNKIKESKVPVNTSNANQLKQANDLNRRDVLKKIDSQRQTYNASVKVQESLQKGNVKTETAFAAKTVTKPDSKVPVKSGEAVAKPKPILNKKPNQAESTVEKVLSEPSATVSSTTKQENQRKEINNQDLIDKTIEGIINRAVTGKSSEEVKQAVPEPVAAETSDKKAEYDETQPTLLDAIEMKMNELHGIPFVERPPHELPRPYATDSKASTKLDTVNAPQKSSKIPNLLPLTKSQQKLKDCEDDIINHDSTRDKKSASSNVSTKSTEKLVSEPVKKTEQPIVKKDKIITEKEFDKFVRRNSVTYENCLTVTDAHQTVQTVAPRSVPPKKISRNEQMLAEAKAKSPHKHPAVRQYPSKAAPKHVSVTDVQNKQYQSKLQLAYQTALITKRHIESPITIIEDKPVKVVYLDSNPEFLPATLDVVGRELSPARPLDTLTTGTGDSLDSDMLDAIDEVKSPDETKAKTKHQRKQVLTPVETPDLELIEPGDLGIEVSPKKKRRIEDRPEKSLKNLVPKKSYLLGRSNPRGETASDTPAKVAPATIPNPVAPPLHSDPASAIDNLVKAAELLDNQAESLKVSDTAPNTDSPQSTPVKRGRGRPRKNPLPDGSPNTSANKVPSPQKKPRLVRDSSSDDDSSDDEAMIKENWTMGKINENIVCPICSKLFRSENVVFKHVKHCTGPSPSRSGSSKRSPRRSRPSRDSDTRAANDNDDDDSSPVRTPRKRKSNDSNTKSTSSDDVIPVETDPKQPEREETKKESRKSIKPKSIPKTSLVCEICGKSFRQLSYLVSHKLQHKKDEPKRATGDAQAADRSVFGCETCKKEFRKLHHLVQHRLIHNPVPSRALRKTSSEQKELPKSPDTSKVEDQSAGFRCEPCDKSFRKLHHLVEHRETHDGINRQRSNSVTQVNPEKPTPPPQCDICKKTFRKLHHLIEHKEQHLETSSEKSDDQKSVKSSLSTKDIIHECNLCYMVFPNEHSLTKHTVICLRKKRQSAAKQAAALEEKDKSCEASADTVPLEEQKVEVIDEPEPPGTAVVEEKVDKPKEKSPAPPVTQPPLETPQIKDDPPVKKEEPKKATAPVEKQINEPKALPEKKASPLPQTPTPKTATKTPEVPAKVKQVDEVIVIEDTPKKRVSMKNKLTPSVTKRQKTAAATKSTEEPAPAVSSSDDDEVRYMFNPDFKVDETAEDKNFMKVRAKKRSSLQFERPKSKELVRRRSLLQHPPKIPRLRAKSDETKIATTNAPLPKPTVKPKLEKIEQVPSTDSDDSDVKYSFPKTVPEKPAQAVKEEPVADEKKRRKTIAEKRKSLSAIAKRKSLGKAIGKPQPPPPPKPVKRRTAALEHRCDCGQLFSSAALLARHATLAHTPPRVRRRRDEPPPPASKDKPPRKPSVKSDKADARKSVVPETTKKTIRSRAHAGVPLPEKRKK